MSWCEFPGWLIGNEAITNYGCRVFTGLGVTMQLVAISVVLGCILAFGLALTRIYGGPIFSRIALGYITFFRGTPLLCQLFLVYYGAGQIRPFLTDIGLWGFFREAFFCAVFTFTLNTAAYQAEILRGGIESLPIGQTEGAKSLGLTPYQTYRKIILPQAVAVGLRPLGNELVLMIKASSIASVITVYDLMGVTRLAFSRSYDMEVYLWAAVLYLIMVEGVRRVWDVLERRLNRHLLLSH